MKLYYYKDKKGNFGDDLNPMMWDVLAPEIFDGDDSTLLVGIGTLINERVPAAANKVVFGSGYGYSKPAVIDDKWNFYCVRGPRTAKQLNLDPKLAITDPAVLLKNMYTAPVENSGDVVFMPHHASTKLADWRPFCERAGMVYMDPADPIDTTIARISGARFVVAEAMHAAIVADAFRVPWIPVTCYDHILEFKWRDWCESMQLPYEPYSVPSLFDLDKHLDPSTLFKSRIKRGLKSIGIWTDNWTAPGPATNLAKMGDQVVARFRDVQANGRQYLSEDRLQQQAIERLMDKLDALRRDYARTPA
jgi:succinoglycan biosynthesis protein ExoV